MSPSRLARDRRGVAAVEFALAAPLLLLLLLLTADAVLWLRARLRMEQAASQVAQVIAQYAALYESDFVEGFYNIAQTTMADTPLACPGGSVAITGVENPSGTPVVRWRWTNAPLDGTCKAGVAAAGVGSPLAKPAVLGDYAPPAMLSAVVVELSTPWPGYLFSRGVLETFYKVPSADLAGPFAIHTYAVAVPRPGTLPPIRTGNRPS